jgi:hypothetical protein
VCPLMEEETFASFGGLLILKLFIQDMHYSWDLGT